MIKFILQNNNWMGLNSHSIPSSVSQITDFIARDGHHEDTTSSIYIPSEDWGTDPLGIIGNSSAAADYSTRLIHSRAELDLDNNRGNETNATSMFPNFGDEPMEYIFDRSDVRAIFLVLYTIVFCSCFFGNLMVILVVTLHWRMRSITNFCLANLAFADLCVGIFCVYQNIVTYLMDSWVFGEFMCKMYHFINSLSTTASVLILVVICIERYLAIIHPMTCKQMLTLNRLRITIVFVWILSAAISSPRFYYFSTISMPLPNDQYEILCLPNRTKYNSKLMDMLSMTVLFLIPLAIITILYTHIGIVLWKSSKNRMPASSTPSASVESSTSSGCYYRETDHNIIQTVKLTLLPVAVSSQQHQQQNLPHHHAPPLSHPSMSAANFQGVNSTPPSPLLRGSSSLAQQPEKGSSSILPSPFLCMQCRNKSKKHQRHRRRSLSKLGRMKRNMYNDNGTPSPVGSRACKNYVANVAMNGNMTTTVLVAASPTAGGGVGQEVIINCQACQHPYAHYQQQQPPCYHSAGMIIPPSIADEAVETTSFIQCCHNHKENRPCVTPASNSRNNAANANCHIICSASATTRNEATSSPNLTTCCGGRQGLRRPRNICLARQGSPDKAVTFGTANNSPPSPFCSRNDSCMAEGKSANTEPIVLVKFEKKKKQSSKKGSRKSQCTILMNTKRCQGSGEEFGSGGGTNATTCNGHRSGICGGGGGGSMDVDGEGMDKESPQTMSPSPPRFDCAICHPQSVECCGESGAKGNDNHIMGHSSSGSITGIENGSLRRAVHHRHHPNISFQKNFSFEHKRNLSADSGISGMPATTGRNNIEASSCDQNIDGHYLQGGVCGALCPFCGTSCGESHQLFRCHHHNNLHKQQHSNFVSPHYTSPNGGSGLPGVAVAAPTAPKRIRRMRVVRSSKYGTSALLSRRRIIRMLIVVVLAFAICHLPFHARKVWQYWSPKWLQYKGGSVFSTLFTPITFLIMYANSAINPILYAFMSKKFRMSFKDLLRCRVRHSLRMSRNASVRSTHAVALSSQTTGL